MVGTLLFIGAIAFWLAYKAFRRNEMKDAVGRGYSDDMMRDALRSGKRVKVWLAMGGTVVGRVVRYQEDTVLVAGFTEEPEFTIKVKGENKLRSIRRCEINWVKTLD